MVGFPSVGSFTARGAFPDAEPSEGLSLDELINTSRERWEELPGLFNTEKNSDLLWQGALDEVEKGWLDPPILLGRIDKSCCLPARRFGVAQGSKLRSCDNLKRSQTNLAADIGSKIRLPGAIDLARIVDEVQKDGNHKNIGFLKADHESAYKQLPMRPPHSLLSLVTLRSPFGSKIWCFRARTLVFGSSSAVLGYNVFAKTVAALMTRLYNFPFISYFDDFASAGPLSLVSLVLSLFVEFCDLIGVKCKLSKCESGPEIGFLGLHMSFDGSTAVASITDEKRNSYLDL